ELMIVVAIIGILAAIALPAYTDYMVRARMAEVITLASASKNSIAEFFQFNLEMPSEFSNSGISTDSESSPYISLIELKNNNENNSWIEYTIDASEIGANNLIGDGLYILSGTGNRQTGVVTWSCTASSFESKYLPAGCR
ncbi:MAG: pilus assembly protein PilE, partial [Deltaproteobacteria bacterium]|nr:pilus assembly protein PilE [Deltaproteobacteria bacterium]